MNLLFIFFCLFFTLLFDQTVQVPVCEFSFRSPKKVDVSVSSIHPGWKGGQENAAEKKKKHGVTLPLPHSNSLKDQFRIWISTGWRGKTPKKIDGQVERAAE